MRPDSAEAPRTLADLPAPDERAARRLVALLAREGVGKRAS